MIQGQQQVGFDELGLDGGGPDGEDGFPREDRSPLRHCPDVAGEGKVPQIVQKLLRKAVLGPQIGDILLVKVQVLNILHHLGQARRNGKAALVGD